MKISHLTLAFSPTVTSEFACFSKSAGGAYFFLHMKCMFTTSSTNNVGFFTAHFRCCSFCHINLLLYGDTYIILSPLKIIVLCLVSDSPFTISSAFLITRFIWGTSYPSNVPWYPLPLRSSTITRLFRLACNTLSGLSMRLPRGHEIYIPFISIWALNMWWMPVRT